jgi:Pyridoxamine 5'-phosphate oxidase
VVKGHRELLAEPLAQQLLASSIPARLAYTWTDGTPRVVSLWFHWDGADLVMATFGPAPKLRALRTGSRVALTIDTDTAPNHVLSIRGTVEVTTVSGVVPEYAQAAARYLGSEYGQAYIASLPADVPMARIAVHPEAVVLLDFETRFPSALAEIGLVPS